MCVRACVGTCLCGFVRVFVVAGVFVWCVCDYVLARVCVYGCVCGFVCALLRVGACVCACVGAFVGGCVCV